MSATNRGGEREAEDNYPTPAWCVTRLLEACKLPGGDWMDPCAGDGAIIRAVNAVRSDVAWQAVEIRQDAAEKLMKASAQGHSIWCVTADDFLKPEADLIEADRKPQVILTNPPYSLAEAFIRRSLEIAPYVAMLLRLNFLASGERAGFLRESPPDVYVLPNRPSFKTVVKGAYRCPNCTKPKTTYLLEGERIPPCPECQSVLTFKGHRKTSSDSCEYGWLVWGPERKRGAGQLRILDLTPKAERLKPKAKKAA